MKDECPCRHCTSETGRKVGCHSRDCPHGWYDWDRRHKESREEQRRKEGYDFAADNYIARSQAQTVKRRRR